ncbi:MAG: type II secretion system F family protein [Candidatus Heimdallarchaeota archaeon]
MSKVIRRVGYLRFGRYLEPWIEQGRFERLGTSLKKAGMDISVRSYLGTAIFSSILVGFLAMVFSIVGGLTFLGSDLLPFVTIIGLILGGLIGLLTYFPFLYWPAMRAQDRKILLDAGLTSTASYLSAMSSSGVPPDRLFYSLAGEESVAPEISKESKRITRDIEIFGYDILKALRTASDRSPSERFSKFLDGISATITSGGDLTFYLAAETKTHMKLKEEETKEFIEQLGVLAEIFMILGVVAPLFFVVILAILAVISPDATQLGTAVMLLLTYFLMPLMLSIMILLVTTASREI